MSYCFPMPTVVISRILGVEATDYRRFEEWIALTVDGQGVDPGAAIDASTEIHEYLAALLARRQQEPRDDLLTFLLTAEVDGEPLSDAERLGIAQLLLIAGIDTQRTPWRMLCFTYPRMPRPARDSPATACS